MPVSFIRQELRDAKKKYTVIDDCLQGEIQIKSKGSTYLPIPGIEEGGDSVNKRYAAYKERATYYGVTKRTLDGLCGQIFTRDPIITLPDNMKAIEVDASGGKISLVQLAKEATEKAAAFGRAGLLTDFPKTGGNVTQEQINNGEARPTLKLYSPEKIINWRTKARGAKTVLSLIVLEEEYIYHDDGFEAKMKKQWRVLELVNDVYTVTVWRQESTSFKKNETFTPKDYAGKLFDEIAFNFIGATNNDEKIDECPLYDISSLNISHYRNSADYEESVFIVGQPTPVFAGLTEDWVKNVLKGQVLLGARGSISLPVGGTATLLQANQNTMAHEAMELKEGQMVALGAKLVMEGKVEKTASEAGINYTTESSVLASIAKNVSAAITEALKVAAKFLGADDAEISLELNTDFDIAKMSPEDRRQLLEEWQSGGISFTEYRANLRKKGIAKQDDATAQKEIDEEMAKVAERSNIGEGTDPAKPKPENNDGP